eukprot:406128-Ditylum_brightwellii.AAC.1
MEVAVTSFVRDIGVGLLGQSFLGNSAQREKEDDRSTVSSLDGYSIMEPKHYQEQKRHVREPVSLSTTAPTSSLSNSSVEEEAAPAAPAGGPIRIGRINRGLNPTQLQLNKSKANGRSAPSSSLASASSFDKSSKTHGRYAFNASSNVTPLARSSSVRSNPSSPSNSGEKLLPDNRELHV